jgi:hypothetical protein
LRSATHPKKDEDIVYSPDKYRETEGVKVFLPVLQKRQTKYNSAEEKETSMGKIK